MEHVKDTIVAITPALREALSFCWSHYAKDKMEAAEFALRIGYMSTKSLWKIMKGNQTGISKSKATQIEEEYARIMQQEEPDGLPDDIRDALSKLKVSLNLSRCLHEQMAGEIAELEKKLKQVK